jgi:hypothetical protein
MTMRSAKKWTPAEEAWFAECEKGHAPLDEYQTMIIRRYFRPKPTDVSEQRGAA